MADYTFYTNPMSRGQIARWALHEAGAEYDQMLVDWSRKPAELLAANPMGKVPTIVHHATGGDYVISEAAAICAYLADAHPLHELAPRDSERADYYRWMFFAAGPVEAAVSAKSMGLLAPADRAGLVGYGSFEQTVDTLEIAVQAASPWLLGDQFTAADVYVGSQVSWGLMFKTLPERPAFAEYAGRLRGREAAQRAAALDDALIAKPE